SRTRPGRESFAARLLEVGRPVAADQEPHEDGDRDGIRGVVEEPDREEAEHERTCHAPEPDVLVQRVHERCDDDDEGGLQGKLYYDAMPASPTGRPQESLDAWMREVVDWHFDPATGTPFWLEFVKKAG